jgi:hypothetical protein
MRHIPTTSSSKKNTESIASRIKILVDLESAISCQCGSVDEGKYKGYIKGVIPLGNMRVKRKDSGGGGEGGETGCSGVLNASRIDVGVQGA